MFFRYDHGNQLHNQGMFNFMPTFTPFSLESEIHAHFSAFRIREKGACSEFFNLPPQAVGEHLKANYEREFVI